MIITLVDTETTGLSADDGVCEVAYMHCDENLNILSSCESLINPERPISYDASAVNGITDAMVANAPTLDEFMFEQDFPLQKSDIVVAHNLAYDLQYLGKYVRYGAAHLCTLKCARIIYPEATNHKQSTLAYYLGLDIDRSKAHSAGGDLDVLRQLIISMLDHVEYGIADLLEIQTIRRPILKMPFGKHKGMLLTELPPSYVNWLLTKAELKDADLIAALQAL